MALINTGEQVNILMQEVARMHKENIKLQEQMIELVNATQKGFQILNEEITRIAKLP